MTIREVLNRRKRIAAVIMYTGLALFVAVGILSMRNEKLATLIPLAMVPFMGALLYILYGMRCPRCRGWIASIIAYGGSPFSVSRKLRFCPFCGVSLDDQCDARSTA